MTRVGRAPSHSALSRACANSLSKQEGPSPSPGATNVTQRGPGGAAPRCRGGGNPAALLPRQRPGTAAALASAVSRLSRCPCPQQLSPSAHRRLHARTGQAVHGCPQTQTVPRRTQTVPRHLPVVSMHKSRRRQANTRCPLHTCCCPHTLVTVPTPTLPSPRTCPCPRARCGFSRWSPSPRPCPNPPSANSSWTPPSHSSSLSSPAQSHTAHPEGATTAHCPQTLPTGHPCPWGCATGCCGGCSCPKRCFPHAGHSKAGFGTGAL